MSSQKKSKSASKQKSLDDSPVPDASEEEETFDANDSEGEDEDSGSEIEAVFEGFTPKEGDFHGIKNLLNQLLTGTDVCLSELADAVISQPDVSSVLKVDDTDDQVFGVICPLSLRKHAGKPSVKSLKKFISAQCVRFGTASTQERLSAALDGSSGSSKNVALLLNERMINLPQELAMSLQGALSEDLQEAAKSDKSFKFDQFVILCKSVESVLRTKGEAGQKKKKKKVGGSAAGSSAAAADSGDELLFINIEDEVFQHHATCSFSFPAPESMWVSRKGGIRERATRTVMLLSASQLKQAWKELEGMLT